MTMTTSTAPDIHLPHIRRHQLRRVLWLVTFAWMFGAVWVTATSGAPLTLFAQGLRASNFEFGVLSSLPYLASLISMPAGLMTDRTGARKRIFLWGLYAQRLLWFPIAILPVWMIRHYGPPAAQSAMLLFLLLMFLMHAGQAVGGPAWVSWMADIVPERSRGKYFGRRRQWGMSAGIVAAVVAGYLLDRLSRGGQAAPSNMQVLNTCAGIFVVAALFGLIDIHLFQYVPEVRARTSTRDRLLEHFKKPLRDPQFLWFGGFVATLMFAVSFMGQFLTLYMIDKLKITSTQTQLMLLVVPMVAQMLVFGLWGAAVDRMGKKPVLALASLGLVPVGFGWCLMSGGNIWLGYLLSAAGAALWAGVESANFNLVLEFSGSKDEQTAGSGTSYVAVNSVIINVAGFLGSICAGAIAQALRSWSWDLHGFGGLRPITYFEILFALSGILRLLSVAIFLPHIHEPEARPAREALRFMTANIYNNLFGAVLLPLRVVGLRRRESFAAGANSRADSDQIMAHDSA
jgi:MFS family permease